MKKVMPKGHLVEKYRKFHDAEDLWSIAMATQIQEQREKTAILDSFEEGVEQGREEGRKQGIEEGQKEGIRLLLNRQMESKYHEDCSTWLCPLTMEQLNQMCIRDRAGTISATTIFRFSGCAVL